MFMLPTIAGCGDDDEKGGASCSIEGDGGVRTLVCADGTRAELPTGTDASGCSVRDGAAGEKIIECEDGTEVVVRDGADGAQGTNGTNGAAGPSGANGTQGAPGAPGMDGMQGPPASAAAQSFTLVGAGLKVEILDVTIPTDRHPVVTLTMTDEDDRPLDRLGIFSVGPVSISFTIAYLPMDASAGGQYVPYATRQVESIPPGTTGTQPSSDSSGTWTVLDASEGRYSYQLATELPADYDVTRTHTVAAYATRDYDDFTHVQNPVFHFRPDGNAVTDKRDIVTTAACNQCHNPLAVHGGRRQEVGLCITCHTAGMTDPDTGNSIAFRQMIHKIHRGSGLPSVVAGEPYQIIGYRSSVHDYSTVNFPQAVQNCDTCHQGTQGDLWQTEFTREVCTTCHDRTSFVEPAPAGFELHPGGDRNNDSTCGVCHAITEGPINGLTTDVVQAHYTATTDPASPVVRAEIVGVANTTPTDMPAITFKITVDGVDRNVLTSPMNRLRFNFAGPTTDYAGNTYFDSQVSEIAAGSNAGEFVWTSPDTVQEIADAIGIPAEGSFAVGLEGRIDGMWTPPSGVPAATTFKAHNIVAFFPVTDTTAVPRRQVVAVEKCNSCHFEFAEHGGNRNDPQYCVICHNANFDTFGDVPALAIGDTERTTNLRLGPLVHRIHRGEEGAQPLIVDGENVAEVRFPGTLRDCETCHLEDTYQLPLPAALPSRTSTVGNPAGTGNERVTDHLVYPTAAACTGCHDDAAVATHAELMTTAVGNESCVVCHGAGSLVGIDVVHRFAEFGY